VDVKAARRLAAADQSRSRNEELTNRLVQQGKQIEQLKKVLEQRCGHDTTRPQEETIAELRAQLNLVRDGHMREHVCSQKKAEENRGKSPGTRQFVDHLFPGSKQVVESQNADDGQEPLARVKAVGTWPPELVTFVRPLWPGSPFRFACPKGTGPVSCAKFASAKGLPGCFEPEHQTQEVLNSFLLDCPGCLYVDIGCNTGYFAAHAAALGAIVECFEPTPNYCEAIVHTAELNSLSDRIFVHNVGISADEYRRDASFDSAYAPCGFSFWPSPGSQIIPWKVPLIPIREIVHGRNVTLLKIDIDSHEGAILHGVTDMIRRRETHVETILVEMGEGVASWHCGDDKVLGFSGECPDHLSTTHPRHGDIEDVHALQHNFGYDLYRVNIHVGREIFDWRGINLNEGMVPERKGVTSMFGVRSMRKLEKVVKSSS
jgi:FkbM family methyltransferase